jgi:hypothetical protein
MYFGQGFVIVFLPSKFVSTCVFANVYAALVALPTLNAPFLRNAHSGHGRVFCHHTLVKSLTFSPRAPPISTNISVETVYFRSDFFGWDNGHFSD